MSKINYPSEFPVENKPMSMWAYFGYSLLFSLPIVGLICSIVFAIRDENNHMKNFAKSMIIRHVITIIILLLYISLISMLVYRSFN